MIEKITHEPLSSSLRLDATPLFLRAVYQVQ